MQLLYLQVLLMIILHNSCKSLNPAHAVASEAGSFTIGCIIRGYHARLQRC